MADLHIIYQFKLTDTDTQTVGLKLDSDTLLLQDEKVMPKAEWTKLRFNQCPNCPLQPSQAPQCPVAKHLARFIPLFDKVQAYDNVRLAVKTQQRLVSQKTTAQKALSSFIGLIMATSGCPHTEYFRPMARFHLPLANEEETSYRAVSMYLVAQYFKQNNDQKPDWRLKGLSTIYKTMEVVNSGIGSRLRQATKTDSSLNALVNLDIYGKVIPIMIEDSLIQIQNLFSCFLEEEKFEFNW